MPPTQPLTNTHTYTHTRELSSSLTKLVYYERTFGSYGFNLILLKHVWAFHAQRAIANIGIIHIYANQYPMNISFSGK